jgi:hypothetical protein
LEKLLVFTVVDSPLRLDNYSTIVSSYIGTSVTFKVLFKEKLMDTMEKVLEISSRIEHLETVAEWIARESATKDNTICQSATLISVLIEDIRERIVQLVKIFEVAARNQNLQ